MAAANAGRINHAEPSPIDNSVLSQQANHRSEAIWNRVTRRFIDRPGAKLTMLVSLVNRLLRHHPVGMEEHTDINDVLMAVHYIDCVQPPIPEAPNEEAASLAGPSITKGPSTSTAPTGCPSRQPVATPRGLPTPSSLSIHPTSISYAYHPFIHLISIPYPHHPFIHPTSIPYPHHPFTHPIPHPSPSLTIPSFTPHPSPSLTIPSPTP
ncbi:hypothetical protein CFP56_024591 [Quercus suber]|uniref:Uncharacterized protein n=1 Tax=Quercus suber TaxID=58331 RepID=A0AAW0K6N3_QUESU